MKDKFGQTIHVGDKVRRLTDCKIKPDTGHQRMYAGTVHTVSDVRVFGIYVESDPGLWTKSDDWQVIMAGEFYVAESMTNQSGVESFRRASSTAVGSLHQKKFKSYAEAEAVAVDLSEKSPTKKFAVMQIHSRISSKPRYETEITVAR